MNRAECRIGEACDSQYRVDFDIRDALVLRSYLGASDYEERRRRLEAYLKQQLITDVGERLGLSESAVIYDIRDGKLYGQGFSEPFKDVLRRGMYRKEVDFRREEAEQASFSFIQSILTDPSIPDGTIILNVSPRGEEGSNYVDNFADTFTLVGDKVIMRRHKSNLTNQEYRNKLVELDPRLGKLLPQDPTDVDLKMSPVIIPQGIGLSDPDKVIRYLFRESVGLPKEEFTRIIRQLAPVITSYVNTAVENPEALNEVRREYVAVNKGAVMAYESNDVSFEAMTKQDIRDLAESNVKVNPGGCGSCSTPEQGLEKGDDYGKLSFNCPSCGEINVRKPNEFVVKCQNNKCRDPYKVIPPGMMFSVRGL